MPDKVQMIRHSATEPECSSAEEGATNIPEPIITPSIRFTAENNPSSLFKCMLPLLPFSATSLASPLFSEAAFSFSAIVMSLSKETDWFDLSTAKK